MPKKTFIPGQMSTNCVREVLTIEGASTGAACKHAGVSEANYCRRRHDETVGKGRRDEDHRPSPYEAPPRRGNDVAAEAVAT